MSGGSIIQVNELKKKTPSCRLCVTSTRSRSQPRGEAWLPAPTRDSSINPLVMYLQGPAAAAARGGTLNELDLV